MEHSFDQHTMILNSFDDEVLSVDNKEKRVVSEMDFFAEKKTKKKNYDRNDAEIKKQNEQAGNQLHLNLRTGLNLLSTNTALSDNPTMDNSTDMQFVVLKAELDRMNTENEHLRAILDQINDKYCSLKMQVMTLLHQKLHNPNSENTSDDYKITSNAVGEEETQQFLIPKRFNEKDKDCSSSPLCSEEMPIVGYKNSKMEREESSEKSFREWIPNRVRDDEAHNSSKDFDHQAAEAAMKKARVSVRARSEAPMILDGCQWRKYGQKMAKGNPCPRAYYRCTMAVGCPVRKQVQRCAQDRSVLTTTYEGRHSHPLPPAAMAMAAATTSAASTLLAGSMPSADGLSQNPYPQHMATLSATAPFPTITLDLTNNTKNPNPNSHIISTPQPMFHTPFLTHQSNHNTNANSSQEIVNAATAAIAADPNFSAAIAAAISSIISNAQPNHGVEDHNS